MDISIIILNYKSRGLALNCVKSIKEADFGVLKYEIIVVDNNSDDGIGEILSWQYPEIRFVQNKKNLGMGAGNNAGIKKAQGKYAVIMNPDTIAFPDTFLKLYNFMESNPEVGIAGPKQFYPDRTVQNSCYQWYNLLTPIYRRTPLGKFKFARKDVDRFLMKDFDHNSAKEVDWLLGSFLFCRRACLDQIGLFDERFFMYLEDTDLCRRASSRSWKVIYFPESRIIHNHKRESAETAWYKFFWNKASRAHVISWLKYLRKWGSNRITHNS
ncbi:MAG: glycosyltransferase family 2 protein [Patescibacteria group bacterium]|nr:glycosyltransferase family 2 protein [Patescibacteria group bacterium]